jgi:DNA-binding transcriptional LysR family regulator
MKFSNVNYNLYKSFLGVYETKNVTRASEQVGIAPSTISHNIKELERVLDIKLFIAHPKGVTPTEEADELALKIRPAFELLNRGEDLVANFTELSTGTIRIGCPSSIMTLFLAKACKEFNELYPNIKLIFYTAPKVETFEMLSNCNIDIVIRFTIKEKEDTPYKELILSKLENCFFASNDFLARNKLSTRITIAQLMEQPLILLSKRFRLIKQLETSVAKTLNPIIEAATTEAMYSAALQGLGIAYGAECFINKTDPISIIEVEDFELIPSFIKCIYNENALNKPCKMFIKNLKKLAL